MRTRLFSCCVGSRAARHCASARFGLVVTDIGLLQRVQDRAVGPFVAGAAPDQRLERLGHLQHARDAPVQLGDVLLRQALDVGTPARLVVPQSQQVRDLGHREAEVARTPDEVQPVYVVLAIGAVARIVPVGRGNQAIQGLREAFKLIYKSGLTTEQAIQQIRSDILPNVAEAQRYLMELRLKSGLLSLNNGQVSEPNQVDLQTLSTLERDLLKDALQVVKRFKYVIRHHFHLNT